MGATLSVSKGLWTNSPLLYGYQWERCNAQEGECAAILGATNSNYTVTAADMGHTLRAQVTATNAAGSFSSHTALSSAVLASGVYAVTSTASEALIAPAGVALNAAGELVVAERSSEGIQRFSSEGKPLGPIGQTGTGSCQYREPRDVAVDANGDVWVADTGNNRIDEARAEGGMHPRDHAGQRGSGYLGAPRRNRDRRRSRVRH